MELAGHESERLQAMSATRRDHYLLAATDSEAVGLVR